MARFTCYSFGRPIHWLLDEWLDLVGYSVGRLVHWILDVWLDLVGYLVGRLVCWLLDEWLELVGYLVGRWYPGYWTNSYIWLVTCLADWFAG